MKAVHIILGAPKEEAIQPLMKEKGIVLGVDRGAWIALEEGIPVDIAVGDFDSISANEKERINREVKEVMNFSSDKDDTDTELALLHVLKHYKGHQVFLYNWYGGRIDHLYSILLIVLQKRFQALVPDLHFVSLKNQISYYLPGAHTVHQIEEMDYLSYILLTEVQDLTLNDVKYPLKETSFERPIALISNKFLNNQARFSFTEGIVAVIQSRD